MNKCIDCRKNISFYAKRCKSCNMKYKQRSPKLHWNYKNGLPKCKICGKQLVNYGKEYCQSCAAKERYKIVGSNPNYKDGRSITKNYCQDCRIEIDWKATFCRSCYQKAERNHQFIDGRSHIDYPESWNNTLKRKIMQRDNFTCQKCGKYPTKLCVHHIDCNKKNGSEKNLITLCRKCHGQIHYLILAKKVN